LARGLAAWQAWVARRNIGRQPEFYLMGRVSNQMEIALAADPGQGGVIMLACGWHDLVAACMMLGGLLDEVDVDETCRG
jgi:hypothetical protein